MKKILITISIFFGLAIIFGKIDTVHAQNCSVPPEKLSAYSRCLEDVRNSNGQFDESICDSYKTSCTAKPGSTEGVFGVIRLPSPIKDIPRGAAGINQLIRVGVDLLFIVGAVSALFFVIWGAIEYMGSGGKKEGAAEARKKITYALTGLVLLGLSFVIVRLVGSVVGLQSYFNF